MTRFQYQHWTFQLHKIIAGQPVYKAVKCIKYNHHRIAYVQNRDGILTEVDRFGIASSGQKLLSPEVLAVFREHLTDD